MDSDHEFTLSLKGTWDDLTNEMVDKLFEAGCDDATPAYRSGRVFLTFDRTASSMRAALMSAIADVQRAGYKVDRIAECDVVSQSDIGRRVGRTRQYVHQWIAGTRGPGGFPAPSCQITDDHPLWLWCEVAHWLYENSLAKREVWESAQHTAIVNAILVYCNGSQDDPQLFNSMVEELTSIGNCQPCSEAREKNS